MARLTLLLALMSLTACSAQPRGVVTDGEDYTLPPWVQVEPYTGYGGDNYDGKRITLKNWSVGWKDLEPERGTYNWALVEEEFTKAREGHYGILLRLTGFTHGAVWTKAGITVRSVVPDWVVTGLKAPVDSIGSRNGLMAFNLRTIPGWHPQVAAAFNTFITEFGRQGFPQRSELVGMYIHGISHSRGEEFNLVEETVRRFEKTMGLSPDVLRHWIKERIDTFTAAFRGVEYKLSWVGQETSFSVDGYRGIGEELVQYAWDKGCGLRGGGIEWYNNHLNRRSFGQSLGPDGYIITDETIPPIATVRYYGEENEEYGPSMAWRWGAVEQDTNRYRMATLLELQCRFRFIWTSSHAELLNPPLSEYARLSFGKNITTTPDAWSYLREAKVPEPPGYTKNFERWLIQRDVPGGMTRPSRRIDRTYWPGGTRDAMYDYFARCTDTAGGNRYIYFNVDDRFKLTGPVDIKVEVFCDTDAAWHLEYNSPRQPDEATAQAHLPKDGRIRTVTFTLENAQFANTLDHGMDFRVVCDGPEDLTVQWMRIVRHQLP